MQHRTIVCVALLFGALGCFSSEQGCTHSQQVAAGNAGADLGVCVLLHITELPEQIAKDCEAGAVQDVLKIKDAHRMAALREGYRPPPDAGMPTDSGAQ